MKILAVLLPIALTLSACSDLGQVGRAPEFSPLEGGFQHHSLYSSAMPESADANSPTDASSLWTGGTESLLGDRRAAQRGDILTVVIQIDDKAEISNASGRTRSGSQSMGIPSLFDEVPEEWNPAAPADAGNTYTTHESTHQ